MNPEKGGIKVDTFKDVMNKQFDLLTKIAEEVNVNPATYPASS